MRRSSCSMQSFNKKQCQINKLYFSLSVVNTILFRLHRRLIELIGTFSKARILAFLRSVRNRITRRKPPTCDGLTCHQYPSLRTNHLLPRPLRDRRIAKRGIFILLHVKSKYMFHAITLLGVGGGGGGGWALLSNI